MHRVSGPDAAFLYGERPEWHFHVSALILLDPATSSEFSADRLEATLRRRVHRIPQFRWRLEEFPLGLDHPMLVDDPDFDVERHLRHIALPAPGDMRSLGRLVGQLVATKLDRSAPLWEIWLIEGIEGGRVATLTKIHHSVVDGASGTDLATLLLDLEPDPEPDPEPPPFHPAAGPSRLQLATAVAGSALTWPLRAGRFTQQTVSQGVTMVRHSLRDAAPVQAFQAPRTPFNGRLTPRRSFACSAASLAEAKEVKRAFDVKLNDVVLAVVGGALRSYLLNLGELPDDPLIAQVPVSLRTEADRDEVGTKVGAMFASMATDLEDPVERLRAIHDSTESAKEMYQEISSAHQVNLTDTMAPGVISLLARAYTAAGLEGRTPPVFNLIVSNVPGPPFDLYLAGARVEAMYPMGPLLYGSGVNCTVLSTADQLDFGFMACPDLMPDPWDLADRIPPALAELHAAIP